jgi:hypothetical protein
MVTTQRLPPSERVRYAELRAFYHCVISGASPPADVADAGAGQAGRSAACGDGRP